MAGPVCYKSNLVYIRLAVFAWLFCIQNSAKRFYYFQIRLLIPAANIVNLAWSALCQNPSNRCTMIFYIQPVANLLSIAINRQRFALQSIMNDERNQFFRKMMGAIV